MPDKYGPEYDAQYCYPGSDVLINKRGITDPAELEAVEIDLTLARLEEFEPDFDDISFTALKAIHRHLFQDIYEWAGEIRLVDISKGITRFANVSRIEPETDKLFDLLKREKYLIGLSPAQFVARLAHYYCELNVIHPFRDGNGRAQRILFEIVAINAGYAVRWQPIGREEWTRANIDGYLGRLGSLENLFASAVMRI